MLWILYYRHEKKESSTLYYKVAKMQCNTKLYILLDHFLAYLYIHENPFLLIFLSFLSPCLKAYTQNCFTTTAVYTLFSKLCHFRALSTSQHCTFQIRHSTSYKKSAQQIQCNATNVKHRIGRRDLTVSFVGFFRFTYCQCIQGEMTAGAWHCKHQRYKHQSEIRNILNNHVLLELHICI